MNLHWLTDLTFKENKDMQAEIAKLQVNTGPPIPQDAWVETLQ